MLMLKADAYGHGLESVATATCEMVDAFGVVTLEEGLNVRKIGIKTPVLVNMLASGEVLQAIQNDLIVGLSNRLQLEEIKSLIQKGAVDPESVKIHVKVDSGMHRLGFQTGEISDICRILKENGIDVRGIYSHFGDMPHLQQKAFEGAAHATREYFPNAVRHIASSHTLNQKECLFDGVRVGLAAYLGAMRVESEVIASRRVSAGEYVGYGDYSLPNDANIATVFGGYADGIDRERFPCVIADGREYKVIGVCMDTFIIDTADKKFEIGKKVTLVDENEMCNLAEKMQTIPYTLMTAWRGRIDKIYC